MSINKALLSKIEQRYWTNIKSRWFNYFPVIEPPGSPPGSEIYEHEFVVEAQKTAKSQTNGQYLKDHPTLRSDIFREGIFLLHKANNICCASLNQIENGILTWSISSIYQSSFFAMKAILCFLGISIPQVGMHHVIIDGFPEDEKLTSKEKKANIAPKPQMKFIYCYSLTHKDHWEIFQRVLRVSKVDVWNEAEVNYIKNINVDIFTKDRNDLHYKSNVWQEKHDLFEKKMLDDYAVNDAFLPDFSREDKYTDSNHYINYMLIKLAINLIKDLSKEAPIVNREFELIKKRFSDSDGLRIKATVNLF